MRNWKNWLFPILTALTTAALALLPLRLSTLEDGRLTGTVHTEPLRADNNFPSQPLELPGRVQMLAQYGSIPELLVIMGQDPGGEKLEELSAQARAELRRLMELGILPESSGLYDGEFTGSIFYLRDQQNLSSSSFAVLDAYNINTEEYVSLHLDMESGHILTLDMSSNLLWNLPAMADAIGKTFLDRLGLVHEMDEVSSGASAVFHLPDSEALCWVRKYRDMLQISLEVDLEAMDDRIRAAMGFPVDASTAGDAKSMQKW